MPTSSTRGPFDPTGAAEPGCDDELHAASAAIAITEDAKIAPARAAFEPNRSMTQPFTAGRVRSRGTNSYRVRVNNTGRTGSWLTTKGALRVPEITVVFWIVKGLSTAFGESASDFLVHAMAPELAVLLGFAGFVGALVLQFAMGRYVAWTYWLAVVMVGIFGTMAADVLHVGLGVPYTASTVLYAVALAAVFVVWHRTEKTFCDGTRSSRSGSRT